MTATTAAPDRIVVAGTGATDAELVRHARHLRDAGAEVIWAGDELEPAQIAAIAVAEDADRVVVAGEVEAVTRALADLGADDIVVEPAPPAGSQLTDG